MKKTFWDKRFPTLLGILLITIGIGVTTFLVNQGVIFKSNASITEQPQNVRITNITDNSFTVSYSTEQQTIGSLNYGQDNNLGKSALDDRDQQTGNLTTHQIHNITVRDLTPQTKYYFSITSGQNSYLNGDQLFEVTVGTKLSGNPPKQDPISGKIALSDGTAPKEAIVYVTADNSQVTSVLAKTDGTYIVPLNSLRGSDFSSYYTFSSNTNLKMLVIGDSLTSNISLSLNQTHPVPTIILSKDYDFTTSQSPTAITVTSGSFPSFSSTSSGTLKILTPQKDQGFTDQQPMFKGTSVPNQEVLITIHSDSNIQTTIRTDQQGNWNYRPSSNLSPGTHTVTVQARNSSGVLQTITQSFVVYAAGQQVNPPAPSVTPTPSPIPTQSQISIPTPTPTTTPRITFVSSGSSSLIPTSPPTKGGVITSPAKKQPLSPTGNPFIITAGVIGATITTIGGLLLLLAL